MLSEESITAEEKVSNDNGASETIPKASGNDISATKDAEIALFFKGF